MRKFVSVLVAVALFEGVLAVAMFVPKAGAATVAPLPFKLGPGAQVVITCSPS
jgi:hypothetical protein